MGIDAPCHAMQALRIPIEVVRGLDTDPSLRPALEWLHGPLTQSPIQLGGSGDILQADISQWPVADFIICGPPCQPCGTCVMPGTISTMKARAPL